MLFVSDSILNSCYSLTMLMLRWITYYPAVEEANELMRVLRDYGLYRDEHKDFCEEMQRLRVLRGKAKERYGPLTPNLYLLKRYCHVFNSC